MKFHHMVLSYDEVPSYDGISSYDAAPSYRGVKIYANNAESATKLHTYFATSHCELVKKLEVKCCLYNLSVI